MIQEISGHRSLQALQRYLEVSELQLEGGDRVFEFLKYWRLLLRLCIAMELNSAEQSPTLLKQDFDRAAVFGVKAEAAARYAHQNADGGL